MQGHLAPILLAEVAKTSAGIGQDSRLRRVGYRLMATFGPDDSSATGREPTVGALVTRADTSLSVDLGLDRTLRYKPDA
jgi:hypothetical protein